MEVFHHANDPLSGALSFLITPLTPCLSCSLKINYFLRNSLFLWLSMCCWPVSFIPEHEEPEKLSICPLYTNNFVYVYVVGTVWLVLRCMCSCHFIRMSFSMFCFCLIRSAYLSLFCRKLQLKMFVIYLLWITKISTRVQSHRKDSEEVGSCVFSKVWSSFTHLSILKTGD